MIRKYNKKIKALYDKKYYIENKEKIRERKKKWYIKNLKKIAKKCAQNYSKNKTDIRLKTKSLYQRVRTDPVYWVAWNYRNAKSRAKKKGIPFNITKQDILNVYRAVCPVLGIPIKIGKHKIHKNSPSLDRINPKLGYIKGNIAIISVCANSIKSNATYVEIYKVAKWVKRNITQQQQKKNSQRSQTK